MKTIETNNFTKISQGSTPVQALEQLKATLQSKIQEVEGLIAQAKNNEYTQNQMEEKLETLTDDNAGGLDGGIPGISFNTGGGQIGQEEL